MPRKKVTRKAARKVAPKAARKAARKATPRHYPAKRSAPSDELRSFALALPGAWEDFPWGESVVKVGQKVFLFLGVASPGATHVTVKLPSSGVDALDHEWAEPSGYGLGKSGWVTMRFEGADEPPVEALKGWIVESYRAIAPKALVRELDS